MTECIQQLELKLLHHDWTENPKSLDQLLSADFEEIDTNGIIHSRSEVIQWLLHKNKAIRWSLDNFRIKLLTQDCALAIYTASKHQDSAYIRNESIRSSIWQYQDQQWKMIFHQASSKS
ncbi:DUF4440 domain-containing protein [Nitrosomonas sp. PY1]|uniref:nuclear transport factor 2 family protein n=1 Tax=Nitrosomonas sp. PY1 TaxID=1803906 RepID=UPI001FC84EE4|nr:nuclear transport factor 2 family protein [Nitrosomonas sp. PY1]